jgi:hypothetical protein
MTRTTLGLCSFVLALSGLAFACGSASLSAFDGDGGNRESAGAADDAGGFGSAAPSDGQDLRPVDNAVILVHAAKAQSFRLCFENELDLLPQPDSQAMPEANVVGVEVGSAVRLGPLQGPPGKVYLFEEPLIRAYYPRFGGGGDGAPTCRGLLSSPTLSPLAIELGTVDANLSNGVHLLVVRGCPADGPIVKHSAAECGKGWSPATSNLSVNEITLAGTTRPESSTLPAQVVNLSQSLESARAGRDLVVRFGDLAAADSKHATVATNPALFGSAAPAEPARLPYDTSDIGIYESVGFRVQLAAAAGGGGAGPTEKVLDESLAKIQKSSSSRDVPPSYYAAASNYALLLLGDPDAKLADGGADDDPRRTLHLLAVPVIGPKNDAGADGGTTDPADAGAAPPGQ